MSSPINAAPAVRFADEKARPLADAIASAYHRCKTFQVWWSTKGGAALFPDDPGAAVADGSPDDGRTAISGADVCRIKALADAFVAFMEGSGGANLGAAMTLAVNAE